ncbi:MAG: exosome complex component [Candidatus Methanomethylophilaceae archaeon]|jgi:exosome complex component CSL4|nr:exosome complex component [Candidatus Methanomethylophilaceae archaeon]MDI3541108.1 exosome complex component [Candidatus Methanomethylophilaceae archaeon]HIJ00557.1 exosome complex RNA-binding protein Csl4 [Candidatus Methanomethylophilaceae archaeon]
MTKTRIVLPGDEVAVEEEYLASEGTYNQNGIIFASQYGKLILNQEEMTAEVMPYNPPNVLRKGDTVYAIISDIKPTMATCDVIAKEGVMRSVTGDTYGTIHVSKISPGYTEDISKELRKGDIIRGKVVQTKPSLQIVTVDPHLGVVLARCSKCHKYLIRKGNSLWCEDCERKETRKIADDYGNAVI